jgi:hypothetical protein
MLEFKDLLRRAGVKLNYAERGFHSGALAVRNGMPAAEVVDALARNRPEMFSPRHKNKLLRNAR